MADELTIKPKEMKTVADIYKVDRKIKDQKTIDRILTEKGELKDAEGKHISRNLSETDLKEKNLVAGKYPYGKNFSFCDFKKADLRGCKFERCNFSFAVNLDEAICDDDTQFIQCNLSYTTDLPKRPEKELADGEKEPAPLLVKCNIQRPTDEKVKKWAEDTASVEEV